MILWKKFDDFNQKQINRIRYLAKIIVKNREEKGKQNIFKRLNGWRVVFITSNQDKTQHNSRKTSPENHCKKKEFIPSQVGSNLASRYKAFILHMAMS